MSNETELKKELTECAEYFAAQDHNAAGWIAQCERCHKKEHTPAEHRRDAEKALQATGWQIGLNADLCAECFKDIIAEAREE